MEPTPLEPAPEALARGRRLYLKREDVHELGAFKWRGALPALAEYRDRGATTVVTASTGNHGAATAWAGRRLGLDVIVFAPSGAPRAKIGLIERIGGEVRLTGADLDEAKSEARALAAERGQPFFEDGAEQAQYDGYRSIAREILRQLDEAPAAVVAPLGNGALLGGIGLELCERSVRTLRVGVQAKEAPVMVECWREGRIVESNQSQTFADGLAVRIAIPLAVNVLREVASRLYLVSERSIARAVGAYAGAGIRVEGAAAAGLAALPELDDVDGPIVLVVTGQNIDEQLWRRAVERPDSFPD